MEKLYTWREAARIACTNSPGVAKCVDLPAATVAVTGLCRVCRLFTEEALRGNQQVR